MTDDAYLIAPLTVTAPGFRPDAGPDEVTVRANGQSVSGWTKVNITRGIELCPSSFAVAYTERDGLGIVNIVEPGDPVQVWIGQDRVVSGYADQVAGTLDPEGHSLRLTGRGKCQDLVDCSAEWPTASIANTDILGVANKLAEPYGILVKLQEGLALADPLPAFNITLTETPFELIEEMARSYQVLAYEDTDGNLMLSGVGRAVHVSGFQEGVNVQSVTATVSMAQRFSEYYGYTSPVAAFSDLNVDVTLLATATDPGVKRHRRRAMEVETQSAQQTVGQRRVAWECTRRAGRGLQVNLVVDSWRDSAGRLWTPNMLARVQLPSLHVADVPLIISEVTYMRDDEDGTRAEVTLMPPEAFMPEPILLQRIPPDVISQERKAS